MEKIIEEYSEHPNVHDLYGDIYTVKSIYHYRADVPVHLRQPNLRKIILEKDGEIKEYNWLSDIQPKYLQRQVRKSIKYINGEVLEEREI